MFGYLASKISSPLPVLDGNDKQKFKRAKIALDRALTASNPSATKRSENEERQKRRKKAAASSPLPRALVSLPPDSAKTPVTTRSQRIDNNYDNTPKLPEKRNIKSITPDAAAAEMGKPTTEDNDPSPSLYHYQTTDFIGWRRLLLVEKVTVTVGASFIMIIPACERVGSGNNTYLPSIKRNISHLIKMSMPETFQGVKLSDLQNTLINLLRQNGNIIMRNGEEYWEFAVKVTIYPKRYELSNPNFPATEIDRWIKHGEGISFSLQDYPSRNNLLIKFDGELDTIQLWHAQFRGEERPGIALSGRKRKEEKLHNDLRQNLHDCEHDPIALLELDASLTKEQLRITRAKSNSNSNSKGNNKASVNFSREMDAAKLSKFCSEVDRFYAEAFRHMKTSFQPHGRLLDPKCFDEIYNKIEAEFPTILGALKAIVFSKRNHQPHQQDMKAVADKRVHIVNEFLRMCRQRNNNNLPHWAIVTTLAPLSKGLTAGYSSMGLKTALKKMDEMHDETAVARKKIMQQQPILMSGHDNVDRYIPCPYVTGMKRGVMQNGINSFIMKVKEYTKPPGTLLLHVATNKTYIIVQSQLENPWECVADACERVSGLRQGQTPQIRIKFESGVPFGYKIIHVPGLEAMPAVTYINQEIPRSRLMTLPRDVDATSILLGTRNWTAKQEKTQVPYSVEEYQRHLETNERMDELIHYNDRSIEFECNVSHIQRMKTIIEELGNSTVANIKTFARDMCRRFHENYGKQDLYIWNPMCPRKEMKKEDLLLAAVDIYEKVGLIEKKDKSFVSGPHVSERHIFQVGDVLTDVKMNALEEGILRRKTHFGNEEKVKVTHNAYSQVGKTLGHLHENIHRLQAIFTVYYGGIIQPIQVMLGMKKVGKDPTKGSWSVHEQLALKIYAALSMLRVEMFLAQSNSDSTDLLTITNEYEAYCSELESSKNEKVRAFALLAKYIEKWKRCRKAVRTGDFITLEAEGHGWLPLWKALGKKNYFLSCMRRIDLLYEMSPPMLEYFRNNILVKMTNSPNYMAADDFCEKQNACTKRLPAEKDFQKACDLTKHLQVINACGMEIYGAGRTSRTWYPSWNNDVMKIYELLASAKVFDDINNEKVKIDDSVLWEHVTIDSSDKGSAKILSKEKADLSEFEQEVRKIFHNIKSRNIDSEVVDEDDNNSVNTQQSSASIESHCSSGSLNGLMIGGDNEEQVDGNGDSTVVRLDTVEQQMRVLKKLNRMKKEKMNKLCKKDLFVVRKELANIKMDQENAKKKQKRKLELIDAAVTFFQLRLKKQSDQLSRVMIEEQQSSRNADPWEEDIAKECEAFDEDEYIKRNL